MPLDRDRYEKAYLARKDVYGDTLDNHCSCRCNPECCYPDSGYGGAFNMARRRLEDTLWDSKMGKKSDLLGAILLDGSPEAEAMRRELKKALELYEEHHYRHPCMQHYITKKDTEKFEKAVEAITYYPVGVPYGWYY